MKNVRNTLVLLAITALLACGDSPAEPEVLAVRVEIGLSGSLGAELYHAVVRVTNKGKEVEFHSMEIQFKRVLFPDPQIFALVHIGRYYVVTNVRLPWSVYTVSVTGVRSPGGLAELLSERQFLSEGQW